MSKGEFKKLVKRMVKVYGVNSYLTDKDGDGDLWFECPECGEPLYYSDWTDDEDLKDGVCPICGMKL